MKFNKIVVNASPIISLANIGQADLLLKITDRLIVPKGVYEEITFHKHSDCASEWIKNLNPSFIRDVKVAQMISDWNLGKGESQVLSFSWQNDKIPVVIDDKAAKKCAEVFNIKVLGTIAVLIKAKQMTLIDEVKPLLYALKANGFRISNDIVTTAIKLTSEI